MLYLIPNYIRTSFRNLARHKFSVGMSILGLAVAFGCCIVAWFNYELNSTFDQSHINADYIYRVNFNHDEEGKNIVYGISPIPMGQLLKENFGDIDEVARYEILGLPLKSESDLFTASVAFTDPEFTSMFTMPVIHGDHRIDGRNVLISTKTAEKYFGSSNDVVGKNITLIVNDANEEFLVAGVYKDFEFSSSFRFDVLANLDHFFTSVSDKSITRENWKRWATTFVMVKDPSRIKSIEKGMEQFVAAQNEARPDLKVGSFYLDPFKGMAARSRTERIRGHWFGQPLAPAAVIIMFIVSLILLGTACVNVINNTISIASTRFKEIGIRKTMGGRRVDIRYQFFIESAMICVSALVLGFAFGEAFARAWDVIWHDIDFKLNYNMQFGLFITGVVVLTVLLAGSYPAFFVARVQPIEVLKGKQKFKSSSMITKLLLVLQLSISIMAVIFNVSFYRNSEFQDNYDLGFSYHEVIQVPVDSKQFDLLRNAITANQDIESIGGSAQQISKNSYKVKVKAEEHEQEVDMLNVGENYFNTLDVKIISGRDFGISSQADARESVIVNEEFLKAFSIKGDPIGQRVLINDSIPLYIVGVTEEIYINALFTPLQPVAFRNCEQKDYQWLTAKVDKSNILEVNESIEKTWAGLFPTKLYPGTLMDEQLETTMNHFKNVSKLYAFLGLVTVVLAMTGLFAMISLHIRKKLKEIGLRKMLGGHAAHLSIVASRPFIIVVGVSLIIGTTAGVFVANLFLDYVWEYYQQTEWLIVTGAIVGTIGLAVITVLSQVLSAVRINPIDIIKEE
jgi:putative ABC transport system permease protein